jgi:hypothetical protein
MKTQRISLSVALMFFVSTLSAQFYLGIEGGVGSHYSVNQNKEHVDALGALNFGYLFWEKSDTGRTMGILFEVGAEYNNWEMIFIDKNLKSRADFVYTEFTSRINAIKIPVLFGAEGLFFPGTGIRFNVFLGFYFSYGLKSAGTLQGFTMNDDIYADLTDVFKDKPTFPNYKYEPLKNYNVGLRAGVKIILSWNVYLKVNADIDFLKMSAQQKNPTTFGNIAVGYRLKFKN